MDSKPAMSTALIGTAVLVILFTTLVLQVKPIARACQASFSRLRLLIMTNVHVPEIRGRGGGGGGGRPRPRSLSNPSLVQVSHLFIHPVKSLRAVSIPTAVVDSKGFVDDRRFMIVVNAPLPAWGSFTKDQATHRFLTQRQCPLLATVCVTLDNVTGTLALSCTDETTTSASQTKGKAKGKAKVVLPESVTVNTKPAVGSPTYRSTLWSDVVQVQDMGDVAAAFFQRILDLDDRVPDELKRAGVRMVVQAVSDTRSTDEEYVPAAARSWLGQSPSTALVDGFPVLIACESSLQELNRRLVIKGKTPLPMSRFRPNIVLTGTEPFEEDNWKIISIGGILFHVVKGCPRCKESCTDQTTGNVTEEPLETLAEFRALDPANAENLFFAQNAIPAVGAVGQTIGVGATVQILQRGEPVWGD